MELNRATIEDYESIIAFYDDVTDRTPDMELYARWQKGKHPTHDGIRAYIEEGSMYLYKKMMLSLELWLSRCIRVKTITPSSGFSR